MKTAVYICGLLTTFEHTCDSINKHLIENNDCDVYLSVWDKTGVSNKHKKKHNLKLKDRPVTKKDIHKFSNVRDFRIFPFHEKVTDNILDVSIPERVKTKEHRWYYSTIPLSWMVNNCHNIPKDDYDLYVKIRPDLYFKKDVDLTTFKDGDFWSCNHSINPKTQISDKFVIGDKSSMDKYAALYDSLNDHWDDVDVVGERLLKYHMDDTPTKYFNGPVGIHLRT